tara:strand:+ start:297 stop:1601 length:1305 start_codon:yes stop_codon:yes gene_type:complete
MATLSSGDTLSLNSLTTATDNSTKALGTIAGSTSTPISMSAFAIDAVGSLSGFTYVVENTSENYTLGFTNEGGRFDKIKNLKRNFDWSVTKDGGGTSLFTSASYSQALAGSGSLIINAGDMSNSNVLVGATAHTLSVVFEDGYNNHATNYNSARTKTVYSVDSYDSNAAALCLTSDSPVTKGDGSTIQVGDLSEGDVLKGYAFSSLDEHSDATFLDWYTSSLVETEKDVTVKNITFSFSNKIYNINNGEIKGTSEHPMLISSSVSSDYRFRELMALTTDDKLIKSESGSLVEVPITSITIESSDVEIVSIDVEEQDTYLVNGYVTHNKGGNSHTDLSAPGAPTSLSYSDPTFSWTAPTFGGTITAYDWQLDNNSDFSSPLSDLSVTEWNKTNVNTNEMANLHGSIISSGTYYFRVRARGAGLVGTYTSGLEVTL